MRFVMFVIDTGSSTGNPNEMANIDAFNESLVENGQFVLAAGIAGPSKARLIDNRENKGVIEQASLFSTPEFYSGFWIIEAKDQSEAEELAMAGSLACNRRVELRPFL